MNPVPRSVYERNPAPLGEYGLLVVILVIVVAGTIGTLCNGVTEVLQASVTNLTAIR